MFDSTRLFPMAACAAATISLSMLGCKPADDGPHPKPPPGAHVHGDHDHGADDAHTHGDADAGHDHGANDGHSHGDADGGHDHGADDGHSHGDADGGHDHGADDAHTHGGADGGHAHGDGASAATHTIGADAFGGRAMRVVVEGSGAAGSELHVEGDITAGPATTALRLWVGDELGTGARKARAQVTNGHFHVHVMVPTELLAGSALWFAHVGADGEVQTVSVPLAEPGV